MLETLTPNARVRLGLWGVRPTDLHAVAWPFMNEERIAVRVTTTGQTLEVVVLSKRVDVIEIVLGEGVHSVRCRLTPTRNRMAYVGNAMGREIVYERARGQVAADLERANAAGKFKRS